ncbi:MAG: hypothetical protein AB7E29_09235 [Xanthobacter sp.]
MALQLEMRIAHQIAGRTRLICTRSSSCTTLDVCAKRLAACDGLKVDVHAGSCSLIVHHRQPWNEVVALCAAAGISVDRPGAAITPIDRVTTALSSVNTGMVHATAGRMDLINLAFVTLLIGAVVQMRRGNWGGPAATLLSHALTLAMLQRGMDTHS